MIAATQNYLRSGTKQRICCEVNMNCTFLDDNKIVIGNMFEMFHWTKTRLQSRIKDMQVERGVDNNGRTTDAKRRKEDKGRD